MLATRLRSGVALGASLAALAACSSPSSPAAAPDAAGGVIGCANQGDTYAANMQKPGQMGMYTFTLNQAAPAPPSLNVNVWTMKIADAAGKSPDVTQLTALPFMPLMGHGTNQTPFFTANSDGTFSVADIDLFMDGLWTVTLSITTPAAGGSTKGSVVDTAVYTFCIDG